MTFYANGCYAYERCALDEGAQQGFENRDDWMNKYYSKGYRVISTVNTAGSEVLIIMQFKHEKITILPEDEIEDMIL